MTHQLHSTHLNMFETKFGDAFKVGDNYKT
jgi:hypothetical protein